MLLLSLYTFLLTISPVTGKPATNYCFGNKCRCVDHVADCTYNDDKLPFIPKLPDDITSVDFSYNKVYRIEGADFFENVTNIISLDLVAVGLKYVAPGSFDKMVHLRRLVISFNELRFFPEATFSVETRQRLRHFDASQNPFRCDRQVIWLAKWMESKPMVFRDDKVDKYYSCFREYQFFYGLSYKVHYTVCQQGKKCRVMTKMKFYFVRFSKLKLILNQLDLIPFIPLAVSRRPPRHTRSVQ